MRHFARRLAPRVEGSTRTNCGAPLMRSRIPLWLGDLHASGDAP